MGRGHAPPLRIGQQHWQAIGHHHGAGHAGMSGARSVGLRVIGGRCIEYRHIGAMHLPQEDRATACGFCKSLAIGRHAGRRVADMLS
jgi:hypothetical protein